MANVLKDQLARNNPTAANLLFPDDEEEPKSRALVPAPAPSRGVLPSEDDGGFLSRLVAGGNDPNLSPEQNREALRQGLITGGLATLASDEPGIGAVAEGLLVGRQAAGQAQAFARSQVHEGQVKANQQKVSQFLSAGGPSGALEDPANLFRLLADSQFLGDAASVQLLAPLAQTSFAQQQAQRELLIEQQAIAASDRLFGAVNSGLVTREEAFDQLQALRAQGDPAADQAIQRLQSMDSESSLRRDKIRDDFTDEGEVLSVRTQAIREGLTGNPADLELIAAVVRASTGNPNVSARNVVQFQEQGNLPELAQAALNFFTKTSELTDPIRRDMRERLRNLAGQIQPELQSFEQRLQAAATAERVFVEDLGVKLPSENMPTIRPERTAAGRDRVSRMLEAAESLQEDEDDE